MRSFRVVLGTGIATLAILCSIVHADACTVPAFLKVGGVYSINYLDLLIKVIEIDNKSCWVKAQRVRAPGELLWINLGQITLIKVQA